MRSAPALLASLLLSLAALPLACGGGGDSAAPSGGGGGAAAGSAGAAGLAGSAGAAGGEEEEDDKCTAKGVYKGPWALAIDAASAKVRWQTCVPNPKTVSFALEAGGAPATVEATETPYELAIKKTSLFPEVTPDYAGTFYFYEAKLTGLAAGCYAYSVAGDASKKGRFCTARPAGQPFSFAAVGDTNAKIGGIDALLSLMPKGPDFTLHGGDIQYYSSTETWQYWFDKFQPVLAQGGFFTARGNHEDEKQNPEELDQYYRRFFGGAGFEGVGDHYEVESGGVWFFSVDTEEKFGADSDQGKWLVARLEHAKAQPGFRYSVILQHRPFFTCGDSDHHPDEQASLEPTFKANGVKLVLQAHMHGYERFVVNGLTYVTTGGGGGLISNISQNLDRPECKDRVVFGNVTHAILFDVTTAGLTGTVFDAKGGQLDKFDL